MDSQNDKSRQEAVGDEVRRLVLHSVRGNLELLLHASSIGRSVLGAHSAQPQNISDLVNRLIRFNVGYFTLLTDYSQTFVKNVLDLAEHTFAASQSDMLRPNPTVQVPRLRATGRLGEVARVMFVVENSFSAPAALSFKIGEFCTADGQAVGAIGVTFDPPAPTLPPGAEQTISIEIPLKPPLEPGREYTTMIVVEGYRTYELSLSLRVDASASP